MNRRVAIAGLAAILSGCGRKGSEEILTGWEPVITFNGRGDSQSEAFNIESGQWRIRWKTTNEEQAGAGRLRVTVHSAISGRPITLAIDTKGVGQNVAIVNDDPRTYFLVIESAGLDWELAAEQMFRGVRRN